MCAFMHKSISASVDAFFYVCVEPSEVFTESNCEMS